MKQLNPRQERNLSRRISGRLTKKTFLIICEGLNTEPDYFNSFRLTSATIRAIGKGKNTISLVKEAVSIRDQYKLKGKSFDYCWVVFDKDDFPDKDFNQAIQLAEKSGFQVAYSNQAFEYWFLLHFNLYEGKLHRDRYESLLTKLLGEKYNKSEIFTSRIYDLLLQSQQAAIKRAKTILSTFDSANPTQAESSTIVFRLVEALNAYL